MHLLIGIAEPVLSRTLAGARTCGWLLAAGYGAAFTEPERNGGFRYEKVRGTGRRSG